VHKNAANTSASGRPSGARSRRNVPPAAAAAVGVVYISASGALYVSRVGLFFSSNFSFLAAAVGVLVLSASRALYVSRVGLFFSSNFSLSAAAVGVHVYISGVCIHQRSMYKSAE